MAPQCPLPFTDQPRTFPMTIRENNVVIAMVNFTYVPRMSLSERLPRAHLVFLTVLLFLVSLAISMTVNLCPACRETIFVDRGNTAGNKRQRGQEELDKVDYEDDLTSRIEAMGLERGGCCMGVIEIV